MKERADRMLTEMRETREELQRRLSIDGVPSETCPKEAAPSLEVILTDAEKKRLGLDIPPEQLVRRKNLGPYKTDFGAIAEAADRVKDIAAACGIGPPAPPPPRNPAPLVVAGIGAGLGVAGLVAGGVLGQLALEKKEELDKLCVNKKCPPEARGIADSKDALAAGSTIAFVAGGSVLALSGIPLIVYFAPRSPNSPQTSFFLYSGRF